MLADQQLAQVLQVGEAFEEQNTLDQFIGVLHLIDGFVVLVVGQFLQPPVLVHSRMQEVLVDGNQLIAQDFVEHLDDFRIAFHGRDLSNGS